MDFLTATFPFIATPCRKDGAQPRVHAVCFLHLLKKSEFPYKLSSETRNEHHEENFPYEEGHIVIVG